MLDEGDAAALRDEAVVLRPWRTSDAAFIAKACGDPAIRRYNSVPDDFSIADAEATIEEFTEKWGTFETTRRPSGVALGIFEATSGEPVGQCGVDGWSSTDEVQIGYWLAARARGRGYATRAVVLMTRWLFELGAARVYMTIVAANERSTAVARRAGFDYEGTMRAAGVVRGERVDVQLFAALPREWHEKTGLDL
jgi:RimJ/RimL family protein N-acetyltransferase